MFSRSPTFKPVLVGPALADMSFGGASRPAFARQLLRWSGMLLALVAIGAGGAPAASVPRSSAELIFPLHHQHNHAQW
jgi:hypothetical protein